jgi:hypothetical protein
MCARIHYEYVGLKQHTRRKLQPPGRTIPRTLPCAGRYSYARSHVLPFKATLAQEHATPSEEPSTTGHLMLSIRTSLDTYLYRLKKAWYVMFNA